MLKNVELTTKQKKAIAALLTSRNLGEACEKVGIARTTLTRWLGDKQFNDVLSKAESAAIKSASRSLLAGQDQALETLRDLMINGQNEAVRRAAANDWLDHTNLYHEKSNLDARLSTLEEYVNQNKQRGR